MRFGKWAGILVTILVFAGVVYLIWERTEETAAGSLVSVAPDAAGTYQVGEFLVTLGGNDGDATLSVVHDDRPGRVLWRSVPGSSFVAAAQGREEVRESRAHFTVKDDIKERLLDQSVDRVEERGEGLLFSGRLAGGEEEAGYTLAFVPASDGRLRFVVEVEEPYNRVYLTYASSPRERFFGFGTQYTYFDLKGRKVPIFVQEQGIGRGAQPITLAAGLQAGAGGTWHTSYALAPHYVSSKLRSLFLENYEYSAFDLRDAERVQVEVFSSRMAGQIVAGDSPAELVEEYTEYAGRMRPLPDWILGGGVVGVQGGTREARRVYDRLRALDTPVAALWLQDWVGQRETSFGTRLWWNWELDEDHYPGWDALVADLDRDGVRVMSYVNPWLADSAAKGNARRSLFEEAKSRGYLVENRRGKPYMLDQTDFSAALVDLSNPAARAWTKGVIKENLIEGGVSGWMADFGEGLPYDAVLHSGESPETYHNRYPEEWAQVNREAIEEAGLGDEAVFFVRSGYTGSPSYSTLFWLGDQLVSWDSHDGIKTAVVGLLSSGISGYSLNHSDIGGYTAIDSFPLRYYRSKELLLRWTELAAFTTVFRTHEGNRPEVNHQVHTNEDTLQHFSRFAKVYAAWKPYRKELMRQAAETGLPVVRHPFIHYPDDPRVYGLRYQFMVGSELIVAPVLDAGATSVEVYLPAGNWVHLWSGETFRSGSGVRETVAAPVGEPAVFYREGSDAGGRLRSALEREGLVK